MGFEKRLADGSAGIELRFPEGLTTTRQAPAYAELVDEAGALIWQCVKSPFLLDLAPDNDSLMRVDFDRASRLLFERTWDERRGEYGPAPMRDQPRTADETWTPIIELERMEVSGAPMLRVLHRITYEPGHEHIAGRVMVPVRDGVVEISCHAIDTLTGSRESALSTLCAKEQPEEMLAHPGQAFFDDSAHDDKFPEHALSRARRAQRWLLSESGLRITDPMPVCVRDEAILAEARCKIIPPPRYLRLPQDALGMADSMVNFSRVCSSVLEDRQLMLGVWYVAGAKHEPGDQAALLQLAEESGRLWSEEGAQDVQVDARGVSAPGGSAEVDCVVRLKVGDDDAVEVQRWISDADGFVWRLGLGGPRSLVSLEETRTLLDEVRGSFRALPPPPKRRKRAWWPF